MMRSTPMRRTAWPQRLPTTVKQCAEFEQNQAHTHAQRAPVAIRKIAPVAAKMAQIGESATTVFPKEPANRNRALLDMARGRQCLLRVPGVCQGGTETTVACHENQGKGMGVKSSDVRSVVGCFACHEAYDRGPARRDVKRGWFRDAHRLQVLEWRRIAEDIHEHQRYRSAANWALKLNEIYYDIGGADESR
jgi:hypothetical protein